MSDKITLKGLKGKERDKAIETLSEKGKKEVIELNLLVRGQAYHAVIVADFNLIRKAAGALVNTDITGKGNNANVNVSIDDLGAGDKLLFNGWHDGDDDIKRKVALRVKAGKYLGQWLQKYMDENDIEPDAEEEKKSYQKF